MVWFVLYTTRLLYNIYIGDMKCRSGVRHVKAFNNANNSLVVDVSPGCKVKYLASRIGLFIEQLLQEVKQNREQAKHINKRRSVESRFVESRTVGLADKKAITWCQSIGGSEFCVGTDKNHCTHIDTLDQRFPTNRKNNHIMLCHAFVGWEHIKNSDCLTHAKYLETFVALCRYPRSFIHMVRELIAANRELAGYEQPNYYYMRARWLLSEVHCLLRMLLGKPTRYLPIHLELWTFIEYNLTSLLYISKHEYVGQPRTENSIMKFYPIVSHDYHWREYYGESSLDALYKKCIPHLNITDVQGTHSLHGKYILPIASRRSKRTLLLFLKAVIFWHIHIDPYRRVTMVVGGNTIDDYSYLAYKGMHLV